ncbi:phosphoribosylpyrophosphate synthetase [Ilyomonas limi]|uniref:Phosphoribosylpyrophosphate synthetase n=1 Tax=Ilyomonas limi TaxID=2575867 RepID=A0A4U3KQU5_9BACT|nr:phosphoribosylpyrophosphate synthetase [Ilyomonas limi]TKK64592.1 phosphoribosylpyrophosphate synthetase [Ilyomonas limi]
MYNYDTLSQATNTLKQRGYTENLNLKPFCIECPSLALQLYPEDFTIDEYYRFEGNSDPADNSIVYAISANDNSIKGVLVDAYGVYAENITPEMAEKLKIER